MATAREEIEKAARGEGCLGKAVPDEPVFVLRAQDMFAAELTAKMRAWPNRKHPD